MSETCPLGALNLHTWNYERTECIWCGPGHLAWKSGRWIDNGDETQSWSADITRSDLEHSAARASGGESSPATSHPILTVPPSVASGGPAGGTAAAQETQCDQSSRHPDATNERQ